MKNLVKKHGITWVKNFHAQWIYDRSKAEYFHPFIHNKKVLHVGCTNHPFSIDGNLHTCLHGYRELHGLDIDAEGIKKLRQRVHGDYFLDPKDIIDSYDVILIPETIEHIDNPGYFLENIDQIVCQKLIVTVPDITLHYYQDHFEYNEKESEYSEAVHDDHVAWYSPYTIKNLVERNTSYKIDRVELFHKSVVVHGTKQADKKIRKTMNKDWGTIFLK